MLYYITIIASVLVGLGASSSLQERIIGGTAVQLGDLRFVGSIQYMNEHKCGGVLIHGLWVLTCGHCVNSYRPADLKFEFGHRDLGVNNANIASIRRIYVHDDYKPDFSSDNDIALLQLTRVWDLAGLGIVPATLPDNYQDVTVGATGLIAGWGYRENGGDVQTRMRQLEVEIVDPSVCKDIHYKPIYPTNICTNPLNGRRGQCRRDGGGPVIFDDVLVGLITWSIKPCATAPFPAVHMKVSHYICWINEITNIQFPI